ACASLFMYLAETLVVCVLSTAAFASCSLHSSFHPAWCIFLTLLSSSTSSIVSCLGFERKNVSCISLVGWSCGEKSASKFQNAVSIIGPDTSMNPIASQLD